jgi:hypothetical protein
MVEDRAIELRAGKLRSVEARGAKNHPGQVEPGEVEARQFLPGEVGRCGAGGRSKRGLDFCPGHFGRDHVRRRQVDVTHHVLRRRRHGDKAKPKAEQCGSDRAFHRQPRG